MTRALALAELERRAVALLELEPPTVVRKQTLPPSGDIHDYLSMAPYWWPNPDTPDGLPWVQRDGDVNPR
jgi:Alginate lyase